MKTTQKSSTAYLSKSLYIKGLQCHKALWLHKNRPELKDKVSAAQHVRTPPQMHSCSVILPVAKFYSPEGKSIQDNGVTPNVLQAETDATADTPGDDSLADVTPDDTPKKPGADELLNKAIQVLP